MLVCHNAIESVTFRYFDLISPVHMIVLKKFGHLATGKRIFQIHKKSIEQVQVFHNEIFNPKSIKFLNQCLFEWLIVK